MVLIDPLTRSPFPEHPISPAGKELAKNNLAEAQANFNQEPTLENTIWLGRRLAYLYRFDEMFEVYTRAVSAYPHAYQLYRHRGHRFITTRQFDKAIKDFEKAAELAQDQPVEIEPDGIPNAQNKPTSNGHFNIWYHLGLARYLTGDFEAAAKAYETCLSYSDNPDSICATIDWHYTTLRRMGQTQAAENLLTHISPDMTLIESHSYHRRLMMYKGSSSPESLLNTDTDRPEERLLNLATQGYGVATWYLYNDDVERAMTIYKQVIETGYWSAFGYIAAEVELLKTAL